MGGVNSNLKVGHNLVIVGGSYAGFNLLNKFIGQFNITLIDKNEFFESNPTNMKYLVDDNEFDQFTVPFSELEKGYHGQFKFIQGTLTTVNTDNSITIKKHNGD